MAATGMRCLIGTAARSARAGIIKPVILPHHPLVLNPRLAQARNFKSSSITMGDSADNQDPPFPLTETDKYVLSQTDEEYRYHTWEELEEIISEFEFECEISLS